MTSSGAEVLIEQLVQAGVDTMFGNPGTTELPLMDALAGDKRLRFVLGLHEGPVMSMADGYALASRTLGVVNLHTAAGLGNAMGMLYNAHREGSPLLITAGQQDRRLLVEEPILTADLAAVARPWTKFSAEVTRIQDLPALVRRAMRIALTPPTGPVFLSLPIDLQSERVDVSQFDLAPHSALDHRVGPPAPAILAAAKVLCSARDPVILSGSRTVEADAIGPLVQLAEALGAPVIGEPGSTHGRLGFPCDHPLSAPGLPLYAPEIHARLQTFDVALVLGMDLLRQYVYYAPNAPIPPGLKIVHLDPSSAEIGKNHRVEVGLVGDLQTGVEALLQKVVALQTEEQSADTAQRSRDWSNRNSQQRQDLSRQADAESDQRPMTPLAMMSAVARVLPPNVAVVEEAVTTTGGVLQRLGAIRDPRGYFAQRGWALGWGIGCAVGAQLAWPDRAVLGLIGDGAAMYGFQALWTAAHEQIPVTIVICNNRQYQILKTGARQFGLPGALADRFVGMDLTQPAIDYVALANALGVTAQRVAAPEELSVVLADALADPRPRLIEATIAPSTANRVES